MRGKTGTVFAHEVTCFLRCGYLQFASTGAEFGESTVITSKTLVAGKA